MSRPSRRERFRPAELLSLAAVVAVFVGLIVLLTTRQIQLAAVFAGLSFIIAVIALAMLALAAAPTPSERTDLEQQDRDAHH